MKYVNDLPHLSASVEGDEGRTSRNSGTASPSYYRDVGEVTYTETANFQSCRSVTYWYRQVTVCGAGRH